MLDLHTKEYGKGPTLLVLHGLFGSLDNWATLARRWGDHFHVLTLDARNHGRSPHSHDLSYNAMASDLLDIMDQRGFAQAHVLGHSMGGKTAMHFASAHPDRINRLIVVDIAPKSYPRKHDEILAALAGVRLGLYRERRGVDRALSTRIPDPPTRQFLMKNLARDERGGFRWKMNLAGIESHYDEIRRGLGDGLRFDKPTLFVRGGKSGYILSEDAPLIKKYFPHSTILTVKNAGHWVHADAPEEMYKIVLHFLRR
jgi:pimeloyl-ACP methyl ester carboxylesterase